MMNVWRLENINLILIQIRLYISTNFKLEITFKSEYPLSSKFSRTMSPQIPFWPHFVIFILTIKLQSTLDETTVEWGVKVERVEVSCFFSQHPSSPLLVSSYKEYRFVVFFPHHPYSPVSLSSSTNIAITFTNINTTLKIHHHHHHHQWHQADDSEEKDARVPTSSEGIAITIITN